MFENETFENQSLRNEVFVNCTFIKCKLYDCDLRGKVSGLCSTFIRCTGDNVELSMLGITHSECKFLCRDDSSKIQNEANGDNEFNEENKMMTNNFFRVAAFASDFICGGYVINTYPNKILKYLEFSMIFENNFLNHPEKDNAEIEGNDNDIAPFANYELAIGLNYVVVDDLEIKNSNPKSYVNAICNRVFCCLPEEKLSVSKITYQRFQYLSDEDYKVSINYILWYFIKKQLLSTSGGEMEKFYGTIVRFLLQNHRPEKRLFVWMLKKTRMPNAKKFIKEFAIAVQNEDRIRRLLWDKYIGPIPKPSCPTA